MNLPMAKEFALTQLLKEFALTQLLTSLDALTVADFEGLREITKKMARLHYGREHVSNELFGANFVGEFPGFKAFQSKDSFSEGGDEGDRCPCCDLVIADRHLAMASRLRWQHHGGSLCHGGDQ